MKPLPTAPAAFCAALVVAFTALSGGATRGQTLPNGVASGDVDHTSAVLWARGEVPGPVLFEYARDSFLAAVEGRFIADVSDVLAPVKVDARNLLSGETYYYRATDAGGNASVGRFRTPASDGFYGLRFGVSGDWRGELAPYPSIANIAERDLDFFVALGDTIYADFASPDVPVPQAATLEEFRRKHNEVYREQMGVGSWIAARQSTAIYACIDDHEVTNDFAGGAPTGSDPRFDETGEFLNETLLFQNGLTAFQEYNPIRDEFYGDTGDPRTAGKRKLYRFRAFGQDAAILLLDARSFRDEELDDGDYANPAAFVAASFDASRTMLGEAQLADLFADLLECQARGITWKFILVPEPIQHFGPILAGDRFEGYAYERTRLLSFLDDEQIDNVVFVAADIHGTIVNNLTYQTGPSGPQISTTAFEITTGSVAFAAPFGPTVVQYVPVLNDLFLRLGPDPQNGLIEQVGSVLLSSYGYSPIGLAGSPIDARLLEGGYVVVNTYGWTEFDIDAVTQCLTVTTWGIPWYGARDLEIHPDDILTRRPRVVCRFQVQPRLDRNDPAAPPRCFPQSRLCGALGMVNLAPMLMFLMRRKRRFSRCGFHRGTASAGIPVSGP